jgi:hypothetical protein
VVWKITDDLMQILFEDVGQRTPHLDLNNSPFWRGERVLISSHDIATSLIEKTFRKEINVVSC